MPTILEALRRTGRTTRMLDAAVQACTDPPFPTFRVPTVYVGSHEEKRRISRLLEQAGVPSLNVREGVRVAEWGRADNELTRDLTEAMGNSPSMFFDHYALERRFGPVFDLYHRYDPPADSLLPKDTLLKPCPRPERPVRKLFLP
ncbi:hypothetical protein OpiT1DRAFT_05672 [Opitutaceae bacterium TAV1]|nr:hypothetical protein OpiT1DRAFT_05672 [Opitutaceae bacterium TAV1]